MTTYNEPNEDKQSQGNYKQPEQQNSAKNKEIEIENPPKIKNEEGKVEERISDVKISVNVPDKPAGNNKNF